MSIRDKIAELSFELYRSGEKPEELLKDLILSYVSITNLETDNNNRDLKSKAISLIDTALRLID